MRTTRAPMSSTTQPPAETEAPDHPASVETIHALPPSAKLVLKVIEQEGTMTQSELAEQSRLPRRTVRDASARLQEIGLVEERPYFRDARQSLYSLVATPCKLGRGGSHSPPSCPPLSHVLR